MYANMLCLSVLLCSFPFLCSALLLSFPVLCFAPFLSRALLGFFLFLCCFAPFLSCALLCSFPFLCSALLLCFLVLCFAPFLACAALLLFFPVLCFAPFLSCALLCSFAFLCSALLLSLPVLCFSPCSASLLTLHWPFPSNSGTMAFYITHLWPFICPVLADGGRINGHCSRFPRSLSVSPRVLRRLSSPQRVSCCGLLGLSAFSLCSFISPPVSPVRYGVVGTVAGDDAPRSLSVVRSSGVCWTRPFSFTDSSLAGLSSWLLYYTWRVQLSLQYRNFCIDRNLVSADRRATARTTTFVEPCSHQTKKNSSLAGLRPFSLPLFHLVTPLACFLWLFVVSRYWLGFYLNWQLMTTVSFSLSFSQ